MYLLERNLRYPKRWRSPKPWASLLHAAWKHAHSLLHHSRLHSISWLKVGSRLGASCLLHASSLLQASLRQHHAAWLLHASLQHGSMLHANARLRLAQLHIDCLRQDMSLRHHTHRLHSTSLLHSRLLGA